MPSMRTMTPAPPLPLAHSLLILFLIPFSFLLLLMILIPFSAVSGDEDCVHTLYIRTGSIIQGGTDSVISVNLYDGTGADFYIPNLKTWGGLMAADHDYFERGNLDIFSGRGACFTAPICAVNLTSDGSGPHHGWYVNYVETTLTGVHKSCSQERFEFEQWLAAEAPPYQLTSIRDHCNKQRS